METVSPVGSFPSPYEVDTPPGCEGWEELYPYYALFDEERREADEKRFWFWNSMHFPLPMPAFDAICIDTAYQALGSWQNRVFAVPPAMGIDYRCINGYIYISGNPVTEPEKVAARAEHFQQRAGYYFEHWDELYAAWRTKMEGLIAELDALEVRQLHELEPDEVVFGDQETTYCAVLDAYRRALRLADLMWQNHFEFLLLGYGAYVTFAELCKAHLPDIPDQHIAQMVAGLDVSCSGPTPSSGGWRGSRSTPASIRRSSTAGRRPRSTRRSARASAGGTGSRSWRRSRTRGSTWRRGTASTTTTAAGSTTRRSRTPR